MLLHTHTALCVWRPRVITPAQVPHDPWASLRGSKCGPKPHRCSDPKWQAIRAVQARKKGSLEVGDFHAVRRIGRGDVGNVHLVRLKGTNAMFAMKVLEKQQMLDRNKMHRVRTEDEILSAVDHPFVATLFTSFQTSSSLYFVMDYCPGGELFELLQKQPGKRFGESAARFYTAEVLLALQYLHLLGFIYRDLKPENVLLQATGHALLTDFDLSFCASSRPFLQLPPQLEGAEPRLPMLVRRCSRWLDIRCTFHAIRLTMTLPEQVAEPFAFTNSFVGTEEYLSPEARKSEHMLLSAKSHCVTPVARVHRLSTPAGTAARSTGGSLASFSTSSSSASRHSVARTGSRHSTMCCTSRWSSRPSLRSRRPAKTSSVRFSSETLSSGWARRAERRSSKHTLFLRASSSTSSGRCLRRSRWACPRCASRRRPMKSYSSLWMAEHAARNQLWTIT